MEYRSRALPQDELIPLVGNAVLEWQYANSRFGLGVAVPVCSWTLLLIIALVLPLQGGTRSPQSGRNFVFFK